MQKQSSQSPAFNYKFLPLMASVASLFFHGNPSCETDEHARSERRLNDVLQAWGMKCHSIDGDGNCCFTAVAFAILTNSLQISRHSTTFFNNLGIQLTDLKHISTRLRSLTVAEWKANQHDYHGFLTQIDIQQEANNFMQSGYFMEN